MGGLCSAGAVCRPTRRLPSLQGGHCHADQDLLSDAALGLRCDATPNRRANPTAHCRAGHHASANGPGEGATSRPRTRTSNCSAAAKALGRLRLTAAAEVAAWHCHDVVAAKAWQDAKICRQCRLCKICGAVGAEIGCADAELDAVRVCATRSLSSGRCCMASWSPPSDKLERAAEAAWVLHDMLRRDARIKM